MSRALVEQNFKKREFGLTFPCVETLYISQLSQREGKIKSLSKFVHDRSSMLTHAISNAR